MDEDINDKIEQLERAIKQLDAVKRHLLHNATEIKGQVQTTMSRHLEALRNREVWLLSQVDLVFSAKEAVLQAQQARLNKMLGVLQSTIGLTSDSNPSSNAILVETLQKLDINLNDLNPEETAFFTFQADSSDLRNTILNYGHVDANGMPLSAAFCDPESQTLPRHFEDYEGPDHHIFHKTVNNSKSESDGIFVSIPKLSTKPEDWLLHSTTKTTTTTTNCETTPRFSFPPFSSNCFDWIRQRSPTAPGIPSPTLRTIASDASIKDWLCQIKRYADPEEEEDFEIVDNSGLSTVSSDSYTSIPENIGGKQPIVNLDVVQLEFPDAVQTWLKSNKSSPEHKPKPVNIPDFFRHVPSDPDLWLIHDSEKNKVCEECIPGPSTDIETLGDRLSSLTCTVPNKFCQSEDAKQYWLKSEMPLVLDVCRANELCSGFEECVCNPHCGFQHIGITDTEHWLIKTAKLDPLDSCPDKAKNDANEQWLCPFKAVTSPPPSVKVAFPCFDEDNQDKSIWLKKDDVGTKAEINFKDVFNSKRKNDDQKEWVKSAKVEEYEVESSTWNVVKNQHSKLNTSDWLLETSYGQSHHRDSNKDMWLMSTC